MKKTAPCAPPPRAPFAATVVVLTAACVAHVLPAHAEEPSGFGESRFDLNESPALDCTSFEAVSSRSGWACYSSPDNRGEVQSTLRDRECFPTEVSLGYYYTTAAGVRKELPRALVYHCRDGQLHGTLEKKWVRYDSWTDKTGPLREAGDYVTGKRTGTWTFQTIGVNGGRAVRTALYREGEEVGASRTIEAGKVTQVACSSRVPIHSSRFFVVDLAGASAEKVGLAEKAIAACGEWSTATCEDFRKQGLFDTSQACDCDSQCAQPGTCVLADGRCAGPASQEDCAGSQACKTAGLCTYRDGECRAGTNADCAGSTECIEHGLCGIREGQCVPTAAGCAASLGCKNAHLCRDDTTACHVGSPQPATGCDGPCAEPVVPAASVPQVLGERRSKPLWGLGVSISLLGVASAVGGIATWTILGKKATDDEIAVSVSMLLGGLAASAGGLALMAVFGRREPVTAPAGKAALVLRPVVGPQGVGVIGEF